MLKFLVFALCFLCRYSSGDTITTGTETATSETDVTTTTTAVVPRTYTRYMTSIWTNNYVATTTGPITPGATHVTVHVNVPDPQAAYYLATATDTLIAESETTQTTTTTAHRTYTRYMTSTWENDYATTTTGPITPGATHVTIHVNVPNALVVDPVTNLEVTTTTTVHRTYTRYLTSTWTNDYTTTTTGPITPGATHVTVYVDVPQSSTSTDDLEATVTTTTTVHRTYTRRLTSTWANNYAITTTGPISLGATHVTVYVDVPESSPASINDQDTTVTTTTTVHRTYTRHLTSTWTNDYTMTSTGIITPGATHVTVYVDVPGPQSVVSIPIPESITSTEVNSTIDNVTDTVTSSSDSIIETYSEFTSNSVSISETSSISITVSGPSSILTSIATSMSTQISHAIDTTLTTTQINGKTITQTVESDKMTRSIAAYSFTSFLVESEFEKTTISDLTTSVTSSLPAAQILKKTTTSTSTTTSSIFSTTTLQTSTSYLSTSPSYSSPSPSIPSIYEGKAGKFSCNVSLFLLVSLFFV